MSKFNDRTGEIRVLRNGLEATIIAYRNARDIDIQFQNGVIVRSQSYGHFVRGQIYCPMVIEQHGDWCLVRNDNHSPAVEFIIDTEDIGILGNSLWCYNCNGYIKNNKVLLHRAVMKAKPNEFVDHRDHNKTDCRKGNLRIATKVQNSQNSNTPKSNTSGYKGVIWNKKNKKWMAFIIINGKSTYLKSFTDKKQAAAAYNMAAIENFGEFALLNEV